MDAVVNRLQTVCGGSFASCMVAKLGPGMQAREHVIGLLRDLFLLCFHSAEVSRVSFGIRYRAPVALTTSTAEHYSLRQVLAEASGASESSSTQSRARGSLDRWDERCRRAMGC